MRNKFKAFYAQANAWEPLQRPDRLAKIVSFQDMVTKLKNDKIATEYAATQRAWDLITHQYLFIYDFEY